MNLAQFTLSRFVNRCDVFGSYRRDGGAIVPTTTKTQLTESILIAHFAGRRWPVGLHAGSPGPASTARWCAIDLDSHSEGADPARNLDAALHWHAEAIRYGLHPVLEASDGQGGFHLWLPFTAPIPLAAAFCGIRYLTRDWHKLNLPRTPECYPKQHRLIAPGSLGEFGNWLRLPGRHPRREWWSQIWNGSRWLDWHDAKLLLTVEGDPAKLLDATAQYAAMVPPARPRPTTKSIKNGSRYALAALRRECDATASAVEGNRNTRLNAASFSLGGLVAAGCLDRDAVEQSLTAAALATGLTEKEIAATLRSGITSGMSKPRAVPA
jgi:hypothetical protein